MSSERRLRPTINDGVLFIAYMCTKEGGAYGKKPHRYNTVDAYFHEVSNRLGYNTYNQSSYHLWTGEQTRIALLGAKKLLGTAKQRARPATIDHLRLLIAGLGDSVRDCSLRCILIWAFFGCYRLGSLCPGEKIPTDKVIAHLDVQWADETHQALIVSARYSKTNQTSEYVHRIQLYRTGTDICPVAAYERLVAAITRVSGAGMTTWMGRPIASYGPGSEDVWTFGQAVRRLEKVPTQPETKYEKGHLTGHSFRRGFVQFALAQGLPLDKIMLHGDWKSMESVEAYAKGGAVPVGKDIADILMRLNLG